MEPRLIFALLAGIALLLFLILKTKIHAFLALIISSVLIGLLSGMDANKTVAAISAGFGGTLGNIGIIIGFGVMMGEIFEATGAAQRMARTFLDLFGRGREELALSVTGFIVSIPIFCDSGFVILSPLARALSRECRKSIVGLGVPLAGGLVITHSLIPPTPGPLGVVGTFGVDIGVFIRAGICISIPMAVATMIYGKWLGRRIYQLPGEDEGWSRPPFAPPVYKMLDADSSDALPSAWSSFAPILLPILLILINTFSKALGKTEGIYSIFIFLGTPVIAVGLALVLAIYTLALRIPRDELLEKMERGISTAGIIVFVTGGGGALGKVLQESNIGSSVAEFIAGTPMPVVLLPFLVATIVRFAQGSGTVAMLTSAGITAPIVLAAGGNMMLGAFAACIGSLFFSHFNDSFFWVTNRLMGITNAKEQIRVWSFTTTIAWAVGLAELLLLNLVIG